MGKISIQYVKIQDIIPYDKNPRINDDSVDKVANSIREFGFKVPIMLDSKNVVIAGHTRLKAAKKLKLKELPCVYADDLSDEQVKALRLADNKVGESSLWDEDLLSEELSGILNIDMNDFGFGDIEEAVSQVLNDEKYTFTTNIPQYEIVGDCPELNELFDGEKAAELIEEIEKSSVREDEKAFLIEAAKRHTVFDYRKIAEYYAYATAEMQRLMERSALVIIDVNNAIANGYATLNQSVVEMMEGEDDA